MAIAPFTTMEAARAARRKLAPLALRSRQRQRSAPHSLGWRVYLPPAASRAQAQAQAQRLAAKNVHDYFVVSAGEQPNSISLGLFNDVANARNRRDHVVAAGFPARMSERSENVSEYWLDVVLAGALSPRRHRVIDALSAGTHRAACF